MTASAAAEQFPTFVDNPPPDVPDVRGRDGLPKVGGQGFGQKTRCILMA